MKVHHLFAALLFFTCLKYGIGQETCPLQLQCINEPGKCLSDEEICDGKNDCLDGQEEEDCCTTYEEGWADHCTEDQFKCTCDCNCYSVRCDGVSTCSDGSDEKDCPLGPPWWIWLIVALVILVVLVVLIVITHLIIKHHKKKDKYVVEGAKPYRRGKDNAAFSASMSQPSL